MPGAQRLGFDPARLSAAEMTEEQWRSVIDTNLTSAFLVSRAVAPRMIARGRGKIINIGSVQCELARPTIAPYTATKGAVLSLTLAMAADHVHEGIRVNCVNPGTADTPWVNRLLERPST